MGKYLFLYWVGISALTFLAFVIDKQRAKRRKTRIPEMDLLLLSLVGGAFGALLAMYGFHHKTHKRRFKLGVPLMLILHVALLFIVKSGIVHIPFLN